MKRNLIGQSFAVVALSGLCSINLTGCGGGADDPTSVALRPNKVAPQGGGGGTVAAPSGTAGGGGGTAPAKAGFGAITGRIAIAESDKGSVPPPKVIKFAVGKAPVDPGYCAHETPIFDQSLIVNPDNLGLKNTFFYLEKKPRGGKAEIASQSSWPTAGEGKLVLDQRNCTYEPHAMIIVAGKDFMAQSQDPVVRTYKGSPPRSGSFNITIPPAPVGGEEAPIDLNPFKAIEKFPVPISCATHNWMSGYQLPLDHPYAAVTDADGKFTISDLPSGTHTFTIWHEKGGTLRDYDVEVKADETVDLGDIAIRLSQLNK